MLLNFANVCTIITLSTHFARLDRKKMLLNLKFKKDYDRTTYYGNDILRGRGRVRKGREEEEEEEEGEKEREREGEGEGEGEGE